MIRNWRVTVDGKPAELLRCNFIMRGVYLPAPGRHTVEFSFSLPHQPLYVTLAASYGPGVGRLPVVFQPARPGTGGFIIMMHC